MAEHRDAVLALNSGSSSLKFGLFGPGPVDERLLLSGTAEGVCRPSGNLHIRDANGNVLLQKEHVMESQTDALSALHVELRKHLQNSPIAVGHRIVHGGPHLRRHQLLTPEVMKILKDSTHFAPLHIPVALRLIKHAQAIFPNVPHFGCFDTAFHNTLPSMSSHLPLPARYAEKGIIRYGFHGLSYESLVHQLGTKLPSRAVLTHLGNGASVVAVQDGRSIDTSMGLTPTGGVPMSTRSGDLDPGVVLYLIRNEGLDADGLENLLNKECGLSGYSGGESDMQELLKRGELGDAAAKLAVNAFCIAVRKYVGAYTALMGGLDLLVFTGGIGEHSEEVRRRITQGLAFLGTQRVIVMKSQEEAQIARLTRSWLQRQNSIQLSA